MNMLVFRIKLQQINYFRILISTMAIAVLLLLSCNEKIKKKRNQIDIDIKFLKPYKTYIYLYRIEPKSSIKIDSAFIKNRNEISFKIPPIQSPDIYLLRLSPKQSIMFIAKNNQTITFDIDPTSSPLKYTVQNSYESSLIKYNNSIVNSSVKSFDSIYALYRNNKVKQLNTSVLIAKTDSSLRHIQERMYYSLKNSIKTQPSRLASIVALYSRFGNSYIFDSVLDSNLFTLVSDSCINAFPNNTHTISLKNDINNIRQKYRNIENNEFLLDKGHVFKDICLLKSDETNYCIYKNTARYKIIYIWRSKDKLFWDYNPKLKKIYNKYSREDLDIIGISAETDKLSWRNYCTMERLNWINLLAEPNQIKVIDPRETFPRIYILDKDFKILAKDPNINDIEKIIKQQI